MSVVLLTSSLTPSAVKGHIEARFELRQFRNLSVFTVLHRRDGKTWHWRIDPARLSVLKHVAEQFRTVVPRATQTMSKSRFPEKKQVTAPLRIGWSKEALVLKI